MDLAMPPREASPQLSPAVRNLSFTRSTSSQTDEITLDSLLDALEPSVRKLGDEPVRALVEQLIALLRARQREHAARAPATADASWSCCQGSGTAYAPAAAVAAADEEDVDDLRACGIGLITPSTTNAAAVRSCGSSSLAGALASRIQRGVTPATAATRQPPAPAKAYSTIPRAATPDGLQTRAQALIASTSFPSYHRAAAAAQEARIVRGQRSTDAEAPRQELPRQWRKVEPGRHVVAVGGSSIRPGSTGLGVGLGVGLQPSASSGVLLRPHSHAGSRGAREGAGVALRQFGGGGLVTGGGPRFAGPLPMLRMQQGFNRAPQPRHLLSPSSPSDALLSNILRDDGGTLCAYGSGA